MFANPPKDRVSPHPELTHPLQVVPSRGCSGPNSCSQAWCPGPRARGEGSLREIDLQQGEGVKSGVGPTRIPPPETIATWKGDAQGL